MTVLVAGPAVMSVPECSSSAGREAVELAAMAGLELDAWQRLVLEHSLGERPDGRWAAPEVGVCAPRQNGKDAILEARELAGLFLLDERLLIHSAHQFDTSQEHFRRLVELIDGRDELRRRVRRVLRSHGEEGIETTDGRRIRFRTRTKGGGRGYSCDCLILNESMILPEATMGALLPTLSARPNPQVWFTGSAVDQLVHEHGVVFARVRERGHRGDEGLAWFEWAADPGDGSGPDQLSDEFVADEEQWERANPALDARISRTHVRSELASMSRRTFAVERLGVGDWPAGDGRGSYVIDLALWDRLEDAGSLVEGPVVFAADVAPDRSVGSVAVAGLRADGLPHVEVTDRRDGTGWLAGRLAQLVARHETARLVVDATGPAGSLLPELERLPSPVTVMSAGEMAKACGLLFDLVVSGGVRHVGQDELRQALRGAAKRPLGDAWAWSRRSSAVDISPLVAVTLAAWGLVGRREAEPWVGW